LDQDRHGNFAAAKEQFYWLLDHRIKHQNSSFPHQKKVSIRIVVTTHQPLYIHPQELNAAQSGGSAALSDITHSEQSFTSVYRVLVANRLELIWQHLLNFLQLTERTGDEGVETLLVQTKSTLQFLDYLYL
jgi:hypothetical protein